MDEYTPPALTPQDTPPPPLPERNSQPDPHAPQLQAMLADPRVVSSLPPLYDAFWGSMYGGKFSRGGNRHRLAPLTPPVMATSRFVRLEHAPRPTSTGWLNKPYGGYGRGRGFGALHEPPVMELRGKPRKQWPEMEFFTYSILRLSERALAVWRRYVPDSDFFCLPLAGIKAPGGVVLEGYSLIDISRLHYAYDYPNCAVMISMLTEPSPLLGDSQYSVQLDRNHATLREDIPENHAFRDPYERDDIFISREFAHALRRERILGPQTAPAVKDPANGGDAFYQEGLAKRIAKSQRGETKPWGPR